MNLVSMTALRSTTFKIILLGLLTAVLGLQLCILLRPHQRIGLPGYRSQLAALVWKLRDHGMEFTVYSQWPDGLWDDGVYITTTDKTFREIALLRVNPTMLDTWKGNVAIMRMNSLPGTDSPYDTWGEACLVEGDFVFFGDKEMIRSIHDILDKE
jgi:hypothetical protein